MSLNESAAPMPVGGSPTPESQAPVQMGTPTVTEDEKVLGAVAYIFSWVTGLIIFFVAKKEQRYARWNALQSIGLGVAASVLVIGLNILTGLFALGGIAALAIVGILGLLGLLVSLAWLVLTILCAIKAYQGAPMRLPVIADMADKHA